MSEIIFLNPNAAILLILPLLIALFLSLIWQRKKRALQLIGTEEVRKKVGSFPVFSWHLLRSVAIVWATVLFVIALTSPAGNPQYVSDGTPPDQAKILKAEHEVIFFIDVSSSMLVDDMRLKKRRLDTAKEIADEVIKGLRGETVSVFVFSSEVEKQVPPTVDYLYARLIIRALKGNDVAAEGTDLAKTLRQLSEDLSHLKKGKMATVIFMTDGEDTEGAFGSSLPPVPKDKMPGVDFIVVGLGTSEGGIVPDVMYQGRPVRSKRDDESLAKLAESFKGFSLMANDSSPLLIANKILNGIKIKSLKKTPVEGESTASGRAVIRYTAYFQYFLLIGIAFYILFLTLPQTNFERRNGTEV
ncbi:vWA domain-containing protein [Estrella lausannensis]|uniref:Putative membrane protein n=1 Tax=Estrella lausannensis TaxID=483423 RepID=A0A0H5DRS0_9BACT|nr:VWA domain-containing protein [Estrella lausannensis]CRX38923.1 putative membrane protein [Estrella lausannensis]